MMLAGGRIARIGLIVAAIVMALCEPADAAITFFGVASNPADNSAQAGPGPVAVTPPSSMQAGDLVLVFAQRRTTFTQGSTAGTPRMWTEANAPTEHGGQAWNYYQVADTTALQARLFWCRFNGTWSANPSWRVASGTPPITVVMLVFRPSSSSKFWIQNVGPVTGTFTAGTTPFTKTISAITTTTQFSSSSHVIVAGWFTSDANTWDTLSGTNWEKTGLGGQYRNSSGSLQSATFAYQIQSASGTTNNVSQNQATLGGDAGATIIASFTEIDLPTGGTAGSGSVVQSASNNVEATGTSATMTATLGSAVTSGNTVVGYVHWETAGHPYPHLVNVTDSQSNPYIVVRIVGDNSLGQQGALFFRSNITNSPTTVTATISLTNDFAFSILVAEIAGAWTFENSAGIDWIAQDVFNPETISAYPAITPSVNGALVFLGMNLTGTNQTTDYWNVLGSFAEILEILGDGASRPNSAIHSYVQGTAASVTGQSQGDVGAQADMIMGIFIPASGGGGGATPSRSLLGVGT